MAWGCEQEREAEGREEEKEQRCGLGMEVEVWSKARRLDRGDVTFDLYLENRIGESWRHVCVVRE